MNGSSTPIPRANGRSILAARGNRHKKSSLHEQRSTLPEDDINEAADDDETERSKRRLVMRSSLRGDEPPTKDAMLPHIKLCQQLFDKNKIDSKNVWGFKIIDYLSSMVRHNTFERDTLKMATSAMEVSVKVFGLRVDFVHEKTMQMVSMITQGENQCNGDNDLDNNLENEGLLNNTTIKRPRYRRVVESIMIGNPSTFTAPIKQLAPINFNIQSGTTVSCKNFISRNVPMDTSTNFIFMSNEKYFETDADDPSNMEVDEMIAPGELEELHCSELCPTFENYNMLEFNADDSMRTDPRLTACEGFDNDGELLVELDGSICEAVPDSTATIIREEEDVVPQVGTHHVEYISDVLVPSTVGDYSYLPSSSATNPALVQVWAGPNHWKFKQIKHTVAPTFTGKREDNKKKTRVKRDKVIQLPEFCEDEINVEVFESRKPRKNKTGKLRIPCQLVPADFMFTDLMRKNTNCVFRMCDQSAALSNDNRISNGEVKGDAPGLFCESNHHVNNDMEVSNLDNDMMQDHPLALDDSDDCEMPETIAKMKIDYAKTSKKIDMKKLKAALWGILYTSEAVFQENGSEEEIISSSLFSIYPRLYNCVDKKMKEALSPALAFSALLHLANEKELSLVSNSNDVIISKAKKL